MAKATRARCKTLCGKRSLNVDVSSSYKSSSSEEDNSVTDDLNEHDKYQLNLWSSKSKFSSLGTNDETMYNRRTKGKNISGLGLGLADANIGGGMMIGRTAGKPTGRSSHRPSFSGSEDAEPETNWPNDNEMISSRKGPKCFSRNAVMARLNRIKKKRYMQSLETDLSKLSNENKALKRTLTDQAATIQNFKKRVRYLESVLANSREISLLLKNLQTSTGLPAINSLQKIKKLKSSPRSTIEGTTSFRSANGFPPPQRDHIYSKTPEVVEDLPVIAASEDNVLGLGLPPSRKSAMTDENDFDMGLMAYDNTLDLPFIPTNDIPDINLLTPESGDMLDADFSDIGQYLKDEQDEKLLSNVGICLHIAESRVSLEFCETCSSSSLKAWNMEHVDGDAVCAVDDLLFPE